MANPTPIIRETKIQGEANPNPLNKKFTFQNANEDRDKINAAISFLPIHLTVGSDGIMSGYEVEQDDGSFVNILYRKHIGSIWQIGAGVSFSEYNPDFGSAEWDEFTKDYDDITIMEPSTNTPKYFTPFTKYVLLCR
jgi:hypothetical protein